MSSRKVLYLFAITALVLTLPAWGEAQVVQQLGNGKGALNWETRLMRVKGIGAPNPNFPKPAQRASAIEAATVMAQKNALECIKGVNISSETTVENFMTKSSVVVTKVSGVLMGARRVETQYFDDGSVEVTIEVPVDKKLAEVLFPPSEPFGSKAPGAPPTPPEKPTVDPAVTPPPPAPIEKIMENIKPGGDQIITGLVIDARGLGLKPAMSPKVLDEAGNEVYGSAFVSREYAIDMGIVGYAKDIDKAKGNERVTDKPKLVKAIKVSGAKSADVVIPTKDADDLRTKAKDLKFMTKCRVMIVL